MGLTDVLPQTSVRSVCWPVMSTLRNVTQTADPQVPVPIGHDQNDVRPRRVGARRIGAVAAACHQGCSCQDNKAGNSAASIQNPRHGESTKADSSYPRERSEPRHRTMVSRCVSVWSPTVNRRK